MNISRDSDIVELDGPPCFEYGQKVRAKINIRNDGTFPGKEIGEVLVKKGDEGYVRDVGMFLQRFYVYAVEFVDRGTEDEVALRNNRAAFERIATRTGDRHEAQHALLECLGECFALATKANEQGIANFIAERDDMHKKWRWQLKASVV